MVPDVAFLLVVVDDEVADGDELVVVGIVLISISSSFGATKDGLMVSLKSILEATIFPFTSKSIFPDSSKFNPEKIISLRKLLPASAAS